jgi:hypothetical protein
MKQLLKKLLIIYILFIPSQACAEEISKAFMRVYENGSIVYIDKKTLSQRSKSTFSTERITEGNRIMYKYTARGEGDYDEYKNVTFFIEALVEEKDGLLYPIYSFNSIRNKGGGLVARYEKKFDYVKQRIYYIISDSKETIVKKTVFPMKGLTVDGPTMIHFLKIFAAHHGENSYKTFYLISEKAQLYRINIKDMGIETLELPAGKIRAIKLRLVPELGLLTGIAKSLIPPTFVWYTEREPYEWLRYEGLETGVGSTHIIASKTTLQK